MDDLDDIEALDGDPEVMRYINGGPRRPARSLRTGFLPFWLSPTTSAATWGSGRRSTAPAASSSAGSTSACSPPTRPTSPSSATGSTVTWGRGLATEGSRALIDAAFERHGARRVHASR